MLSDEVCSSRQGAARRCRSSATAVALALILAACGSEAENTAAPDQQSGADTDKAAASESTTTNTAAESSGGGQEETMVADATDSSGGGEQAKKEEQKREPMDGYTVYHRFCVTCHKTGMNGAPKYGNKKAWEPRIAQGAETLHKHAINGLRAMPPKGGIAGLYDQEVKDAVDYMVKAAGGYPSDSE